MSAVQFNDPQQLEAAIRRATFLQLALSVNDQPYVVPLNYGYQDGVFYFHSKTSGQKLEWLRQNGKAAFSLQTDVETLHPSGAKAENCSMQFISVLGSGRVELIEDHAGKSNALDIICQQYDLAAYEYSEKMLQAVTIFKLTVSEMSGRAKNLDLESCLKGLPA
ncbi:MAG: pyridoxamine 5'-phosphate oxidase family protein [Anaerolineaceae bacterium]|nr:pyridoxamine 5'-phosphate oxidase family protein [Anaerolineaceae bacterium]